MSSISLNNNISFQNKIAQDNTKVASKPNVIDLPKKEIDKNQTTISHQDSKKVSNNTATGKAHVEVNLIDDHHDDHSMVETVTHKAHKGHVGYEIATAGSKVAINTGKTIANSGKNLAIAGSMAASIETANSGKFVAKTAATLGATPGLATSATGKFIANTGKFLHDAHHATEATQKVILKTMSKGASSVGATKTAAQISKLATAGHAAHGAAEAAHVASGAVKAVKVVSTGAKAAAVLGKVAPGIGFAAGMVGAGLAINEARNSKTSAGVAVHSVRAGLNVIAGGASFVPGVGTAVGLIATGADLGLSFAAKKLGWN